MQCLRVSASSNPSRRRAQPASLCSGEGDARQDRGQPHLDALGAHDSPPNASRLREALAQLDAQGSADWTAYQAQRAAKEAAAGRKLPDRKATETGRTAKRRHANVTDPQSRMLRSGQRYVQGYNAQAAVTGQQVVVAAEVTNAANETTQFRSLLAAAEANLSKSGYAGEVGAVLADAGYWSTGNALTDT